MLMFRNQPRLLEIWQGFGQGGGVGGRGRFHFFVKRGPPFLQEACLRRKLAHVRAHNAYFYLDALLPTGRGRGL
jgi:hypothetical protein